MKNEDFLEMLGNIDDSIIDECTSFTVYKKKHRYVKEILTLAAVFCLAVCAVLISRLVPDELLTGFNGEEHSVSENYEGESTLVSQDTTAENQLTEPSVTEELLSAEEILSAEEVFSIETVSDVETTVPFISETATADEITVPPEETTEAQISSESQNPYFVEVPSDSLRSVGDGASQGGKKVSLAELFRLYGTVILPSVMGEIFPGFQEIFNGSGSVISGGTSTSGNNMFSFTLPDGSALSVEASAEALALTESEEENLDYTSEIEGTDVLLLKGSETENGMIFSAYFEKNGVCFRIIQQGENLSEDEFVDIIKSLL